MRSNCRHAGPARSRLLQLKQRKRGTRISGSRQKRQQLVAHEVSLESQAEIDITVPVALGGEYRSAGRDGS